MGVKVRERPEGSGVWWIFIDHQGNRKAKKVGKDKKLAHEVAKKLEAKLTLGDVGLPDKEAVPKFSKYADIWIASTVPATCKASTLRDYQSILKHHVLPIFGNTPVTEISRLDVKRFLTDKINAGFTASTVTHMKNCLSGTLNLAIDDGILQANPAHKLGRVIRSKGLQIDNREALCLLLEAVQEHYPSHYPMALTLARTGMRLGGSPGLAVG